MRRTAIHLLARLAVAATSMSSAAAFDATHIFHMTGVIVSRSHPLEHRRHEGSAIGFINGKRDPK
jgi:hypothetical protein